MSGRFHWRATRFGCEFRLMMKRAVVAVGCLIGLCLPVGAQQPGDVSGPLSLYQANGFNAADGSLLLRSMPIALSDGRYFSPSMSIGSMGMVSLDFLPVALLTGTQRRTASGTRSSDGERSLGTIDEPSRVYVGGEMGVLYGRSTGKYGGDEFSSYIFGSVGNEHFQITAGAAYDEFNGRFPRGRR
jgi:hypothetical protein